MTIDRCTDIYNRRDHHLYPIALSFTASRIVWSSTLKDLQNLFCEVPHTGGISPRQEASHYVVTTALGLHAAGAFFIEAGERTDECMSQGGKAYPILTIDLDFLFLVA